MYIRNKLIVAMLIITLVPVILVSIVSLTIEKNVIQSTRISQLESIADLKVEKITTYFQDCADDMQVALQLNAVKEYYSYLNIYMYDRKHPYFIGAVKMLDDQLSPFLKVHHYANIYLLNTEGKLIHIVKGSRYSRPLWQPLPSMQGKIFDPDEKGIYFAKIHVHNEDNDRKNLIIASPVEDSHGTRTGILAIEIDLEPLFTVLQDRTGLGRTGETLVGIKEGENVLFISQLRHEPNAGMKKRMKLADYDPLPIVKAVNGQNSSGISKDYREKSVVAAWRYIPSLRWGITAKIDSEEAFDSITETRNLIFFFTAIIILLSTVFTVMISRSISKPIHDLHHGTEIIGEGNLDFKVGTPAQDEIGQLSRAFDEMTENLKSITASRDELNKQIEERKLFEERMRMQSVALESAATAMVITDSHGDIIWANPAFTKLTGYEVSEVIGKNPRILKSGKHDDAFYKEMWDTIHSGKVWRSELYNLHKNGTIYWEEMTITPVYNDQGKIEQYIAIKQDITRRKEMDNMKNRFISMVSHELRTPLTSILGALGLIAGGATGNFSPQAEQLINIAYRNSERLLSLINDILDIEKIEAGKMKFNIKSVDIKALAEKSIESMKIFGEKLGVQYLLVDALPETVMIRADSDRLMQVMTNLLSNAAKFSPQGSTVEISITRKRPMVCISIADHGHGIPENFRPRVFEKFAQANVSDSQSKPGTGLGLSICKAIIELLHGTIGFASQEGFGSTFYFELPEWRDANSSPSDSIEMKIDANNSES